MTRVLAMSLEGKKIVLGITGGIAAFKAASIASQLRKSGAESVFLNNHDGLATARLITPLTLREIQKSRCRFMLKTFRNSTSGIA